MRVAALYDIHANLPALEAVLDEVRRSGVDHVVVGGDVLPGPMPRETLDLLLELDLPAHFLHGNGDREVLARMQDVETEWYRGAPEAWREPVRWSAEQLGAGHRQLLSSWPPTCRLRFPDLGQVLFCHATPWNDTECFTTATPEERLVRIFAPVEDPVVVCGHTHVQFDHRVGRTRVVNAGSVGMASGEPGACWLLLGPGVELRRTPYDLARGAERVRATPYPQAEEFVEHSMLHPLSESEAFALYAGATSN